MTREKAAKTADIVLDLYRTFGNEDYIGEPVSQLEHMCQCAQLAGREGYDDEVILAAFFHDIGHLCEHILDVSHMDGFGIVDHEKVGADFLAEKGFSKKITDLIQSHVAAKRYLTFVHPEYFQNLSEASKKTLKFQGGRMTEEEAIEFEKDNLFPLYLTLRGWDDKAKEEDTPVPNLDYFRQMIIDHLLIKSPSHVY